MTTKVDDLIDRLETVREEKGLPKARFGPNELGVAEITYRKWTYREYEKPEDGPDKARETT